MIVAGVVAFAVALVATPVAMHVARRTGIVDRPGPLKPQAAPVPYLGGAAVLVAVAAAVGAAVALGMFPRRSGLLLAFVAATALGTVDDRLPLPPWLRLVGQLAIGGGIAAVVHPRLAGPAAPAAVVLATVVLVNGVNLIDGLDGLAAGTVGVAAVGFAILLAGPGRALGVVVALAVAGFLPYNRPPARVYLGDGGSYLLGTSLAAMLALAWSPGTARATSAAALCVVVVPALEVALAVVRRLRSRAPLSAGDRRHPYDLLVARGWPAGRASAGYVVTEASTVAVAVVAAHATAAVATVAVVVVAAVLVVVAVRLGALGPPAATPG
ncbi:MAG TPA: MraY family glycosyltransferase [Acidimicrobiales bacterium]|nr:MraY family glycosyltransferase [Acidimicrobiales bacterium]